MKFYVVVINGDVATIAQLSDEDGERLRTFCKEQEYFETIRVFEQTEVNTSLEITKEDIAAELDSWR